MIILLFNERWSGASQLIRHSIEFSIRIHINGKAGTSKVYKIIYMKAEYEPWWKFDGWEEQIVFTKEFLSEKEFQQCLAHTLAEFRKQYKYESKKNNYFAFWKDEERVYCEACEDDIQVYHGIICEGLKE
ncbi:DUF1033 family protein [Lysinibacillus yapensis]|uniref:DUF1033 family protein n=2 Tax=Ureibacillus yapensis TaxID=2304605 RepID=A0A396S9U1_9BACL|nr:DUF1033 family protein [Lysinibacillus yapensis]